MVKFVTYCTTHYYWLWEYSRTGNFILDNSNSTYRHAPFEAKTVLKLA